MLVLSRRPGEQITIGEQIIVTVLQVRGNRVTLGFLGPGEVPIYRKEVTRADRKACSPAARDSAVTRL